MHLNASGPTFKKLQIIIAKWGKSVIQFVEKYSQVVKGYIQS